jgi:hypothetical protein
VAGRDSLEAMASFVDRHDLGDMVNIADVSGDVWTRFGVFGQPTWGFVNGDTGDVTVAFGALGADGVAAAFAARSLR